MGQICPRVVSCSILTPDSSQRDYLPNMAYDTWGLHVSHMLLDILSTTSKKSKPEQNNVQKRPNFSSLCPASNFKWHSTEAFTPHTPGRQQGPCRLQNPMQHPAQQRTPSPL